MKNVLRTNSFFTKKLLSQMVILVDDNTRAAMSGDVGGEYLVARLPEHCIVQDAYVFVQATGVAATTAALGTTAGGTEIMSAAALDALGNTGTFTGQIDTGTGVDVFLDQSADPTGDFIAVIEYLEYKVDTGSMTRI